MAPHSSTLAWKIPWMEEPGGLQSIGSLRVGHDWATSLSCIGEGNGNPLQCSCLENPRDGGAWWAAVYAVMQSQTRLKQLGGSSSIIPSFTDSIVWISHNLSFIVLILIFSFFANMKMLLRIFFYVSSGYKARVASGYGLWCGIVGMWHVCMRLRFL